MCTSGFISSERGISARSYSEQPHLTADRLLKDVYSNESCRLVALFVKFSQLFNERHLHTNAKFNTSKCLWFTLVTADFLALHFVFHYQRTSKIVCPLVGKVFL